MEKKKRSKVLLIIGIVLGILVIGFGSYFVYDKYFSKEDDKGNKEENNKFDITLMSTEDRKILLEELVSLGRLEELSTINDSDVYLQDIKSAKIDEDGELVIHHGDDTIEKYYFGEIDQVYVLHCAGAIPCMLIINQNNDLYAGIPWHYQISDDYTNLGNNRVVSIYVDVVFGGTYVLFDDYSLINLYYNFDDEKNVLGNDILDNDFPIEAIEALVMCSDYCTDPYFIVSFDGLIKAKTKDEDYIELKYNNKSIEFIYGYYEYVDNEDYVDIADIYLIDSDNNVYVIKNYTISNRNTKLEKLSYKFDSYTVNKSENGVSHYTIKYSDGSTKEKDEYNFVDITKYSKIFDIYNKYNKN